VTTIVKAGQKCQENKAVQLIYFKCRVKLREKEKDYTYSY